MVAWALVLLGSLVIDIVAVLRTELFNVLQELSVHLQFLLSDFLCSSQILLHVVLLAFTHSVFQPCDDFSLNRYQLSFLFHALKVIIQDFLLLNQHCWIIVLILGNRHGLLGLFDLLLLLEKWVLRFTFRWCWNLFRFFIVFWLGFIGSKVVTLGCWLGFLLSSEHWLMWLGLALENWRTSWLFDRHNQIVFKHAIVNYVKLVIVVRVLVHLVLLWGFLTPNVVEISVFDDGFFAAWVVLKFLLGDWWGLLCSCPL